MTHRIIGVSEEIREDLDDRLLKLKIAIGGLMQQGRDVPFSQAHSYAMGIHSLAKGLVELLNKERANR